VIERFGEKFPHGGLAASVLASVDGGNQEGRFSLSYPPASARLLAIGDI